MLTNKKIIQSISLLIFLWSCNTTAIINNAKPISSDKKYANVKTGLDVLLENHIDKLYGNKIALVTNHSGLDMFGESNVSRFLSLDSINLVKIFTPEHGFTGLIPDGEAIEHDTVSQLLPPIISLYGTSKKPTLEMYHDIDLIIYDIQDVGARFYTYISTLGLVMETAGETNIPVIVLDRPNPIGNKVEGPVLDIDYKSFVGQYPIPIRYGMTIGELAKMIVGEKMINPVPEIIIIPMKNYKGHFYYDKTKLPWVNPSPNIVDLETAFVYPGLNLLQGVNVSNGRGTYLPIKRVGAPWIDSKQLLSNLKNENLHGVTFVESIFTPTPLPSMAVAPIFQDTKCYGIDINVTDPTIFNSVETGLTVLYYLNKMYPDSFSIKPKSIARLWGSNYLNDQLKEGKNPEEIIDFYQENLNNFIQIQKKYLIYQ
jgi:uncharacterized protein YbbC (DUF1343 family)